MAWLAPSLRATGLLERLALGHGQPRARASDKAGVCYTPADHTPAKGGPMPATDIDRLAIDTIRTITDCP